MRSYLYLIILLIVLSTSSAYAQTDITASARVIESIQVTAINDLQFGDLTQGETVNVEPDEAEAGLYSITGETQSEVQLTFNLPNVLENIIDPSETMPATFSETSGIFNQSNDASTGNSFDPSVDASAQLSVGGELYIFIGGSVTAAPGQIPGEYEATITLTVDYVN